MTIADAINKFIKDREYTSYLEIGVFEGDTFNSVNIEHKEGIDPTPQIEDSRIHIGTVDDHSTRRKFDIILIDGHHGKEYVENDLRYAIRKLKKDGVILFHDVLPPTEWHTRPFSEYSYPEEWCGQAAEVFVNNDVSPESKDEIYDKYIIDSVPYGLGVIDSSIVRDAFDYEPATSWEELNAILKTLIK